MTGAAVVVKVPIPGIVIVKPEKSLRLMVMVDVSVRVELPKLDGVTNHRLYVMVPEERLPLVDTAWEFGLLVLPKNETPAEALRVDACAIGAATIDAPRIARDKNFFKGSLQGKTDTALLQTNW